jgi:hypothetical protein
MPEHPTSLSLAALKEILAGVERTLVIFERSGLSLRDPAGEVGIKLRKLKHQLEAQVKRHPDNRDR